MNKIENNLQIYRVYVTDRPLENSYLLVLGFTSRMVSGLLFNKETLAFDCAFTIRRRGRKFTSVGYIYLRVEEFGLKLFREED